MIFKGFDVVCVQFEDHVKASYQTGCLLVMKDCGLEQRYPLLLCMFASQEGQANDDLFPLLRFLGDGETIPRHRRGPSGDSLGDLLEA